MQFKSSSLATTWLFLPILLVVEIGSFGFLKIIIHQNVSLQFYPPALPSIPTHHPSQAEMRSKLKQRRKRGEKNLCPFKGPSP
jgi:hypothetical protein